jgi:hypothetical protein
MVLPIRCNGAKHLAQFITIKHYHDFAFVAQEGDQLMCQC